MELICWGRRSPWREWCRDKGVEAACRGREGFMWGTVHMASSVIGNETKPERMADLISSPSHTAALVLSGSDQATCCLGFVVCAVCVCTQCVTLHIVSVTCLLFAKLFSCKIGQVEKHGRSLCGFHGLYKDAYKLCDEHFVISHQKRRIETLKIWGEILRGLLFCVFCVLTVFFYFCFCLQSCYCTLPISQFPCKTLMEIHLICIAFLFQQNQHGLTSPTSWAEPLNGDAANSHFFSFFFPFCELSKDSPHIEMETRLLTNEKCVPLVFSFL